LWDQDDQLGDEKEDDDDTPANLNVGYKAVTMMVETFENEHSILRTFPTGVLHPQPFKEGARAKFEKTAAAVRQKHGLDFPGAVVQWNDFLEMAPKNDDVYEYIAENPLYVPFKDELFGISSDDGRYAESSSGYAADQIQQQEDKVFISFHNILYHIIYYISLSLHHYYYFYYLYVFSLSIYNILCVPFVFIFLFIT
jgi:hypothetical protein